MSFLLTCVGVFWEDKGSGVYIARTIGCHECLLSRWTKLTANDCQ